VSNKLGNNISFITGWATGRTFGMSNILLWQFPKILLWGPGPNLEYYWKIYRSAKQKWKVVAVVSNLVTNYYTSRLQKYNLISTTANNTPLQN